MENGSVDTKETKATKTRRKDQLRVQAFYLRGQLDAAEQLLRNAQKIAYGMFGEMDGALNGELTFLTPPKKRRRPRSPEAIKRAVATRKANQKTNARRVRDLQRQVEKLTGKPQESDAAKPKEKVGERETAGAAA